MQSVIKPYLVHFKDFLLPKPIKLTATHHPTFLQEAFVAVVSNTQEFRCQLKHLHQDNYLQEFADIQKRIELNQCEGLMRFEGIHLEYQSAGTLLYIMYEMEQLTFRDLFATFQTKEESFWRVFFPIVRSLAYLQKKKINHGNLNYYNVLMTKHNQIKLLYNVGQPSSIDLYYMDSKGSDWEYLFLSPEQLEAQTLADVQNRSKSDVFNLGAILLTQLVDTREGVYGDEKYLEKQLNTLKLKYSYSLGDILSRMLQLDPQERPTFFQLCLLLDQLQNNVQQVTLTQSRLYTDSARRMTRDLLSAVDLKETRRTQAADLS